MVVVEAIVPTACLYGRLAQPPYKIERKKWIALSKITGFVRLFI
jgi:hypothetical protein